jgi:hypothetical protein
MTRALRGTRRSQGRPGTQPGALHRASGSGTSTDSTLACGIEPAPGWLARAGVWFDYPRSRLRSESTSTVFKFLTHSAPNRCTVALRQNQPRILFGEGTSEDPDLGDGVRRPLGAAPETLDASPAFTTPLAPRRAGWFFSTWPSAARDELRCSGDAESKAADPREERGRTRGGQGEGRSGAARNQRTPAGSFPPASETGLVPISSGARGGRHRPSSRRPRPR